LEDNQQAVMTNTQTGVRWNENVQALYDDCYKSLLSFFHRRIAEEDDAQDLAQQVFARLIQAGPRQDMDFCPALVFHIANCVLRDRFKWRKSNRIARYDPFEETHENLLFCEQPQQDRILEARQRLTAVYEEIEKLPATRKQVFLLHRVRDFSQREVADHLGLSVRSVEKHMVKAVLHLSRALDDLS